MAASSSFDARLGYQLRRAQFAYRSALDRALAPVGLSSASYLALATLDMGPGLSSAALSRRCGVTAQAMNTVLRSLETEGLVERTPHATHGRIREARLTEAGRTALRAAHAASKPVEQRLVGALPEELRAVVTASLKTCADALDA